MIGLFGIGEILLTMEEGLAFKGKSAKINLKVVFQTWYQLLSHWKTFLRSVAIGCWMGITPGGATPASFMSYGMARRMSKDPDTLRQGQDRRRRSRPRPPPTRPARRRCCRC